MMPRKFRWRRIDKILTDDPTGTAEVVVAFCFVLIPGSLFAGGRADLPPITERIMFGTSFSEIHMGWCAVALAVMQIWGAGTDWFKARAWISTAIAASAAIVVVAYCLTGYMYRPTVPMLGGVVLAEMFIAWRCWHERPPVRGEFSTESNRGQSILHGEEPCAG